MPTSLFRAIPGVFNAFIIMVIFMSIYAIIGVEIFGSFGQEGEYYTVRPGADVLNYVAKLRGKYDPTWAQAIQTKAIAATCHTLRHSTPHHYSLAP